MLKALSMRREGIRSGGRFAVAFHLGCAVATMVFFLGLFYLLCRAPDDGGPRLSTLASVSGGQAVNVFVGLVCMACFVSTLAAGLVVWCVVDAERVRKQRMVLRGKEADESWCRHVTDMVESNIRSLATAYSSMPDDISREYFKGRAQGVIDIWKDMTAGGVVFDERRRVGELFNFYVRRCHEFEAEEEC